MSEANAAVAVRARIGRITDPMNYHEVKASAIRGLIRLGRTPEQAREEQSERENAFDERRFVPSSENHYD